MGEYAKNSRRVRHERYGTGSIVRTTVRPSRVWVRWDETGLTTPVSPERLRQALAEER